MSILKNVKGKAVSVFFRSLTLLLTLVYVKIEYLAFL